MEPGSRQGKREPRPCTHLGVRPGRELISLPPPDAMCRRADLAGLACNKPTRRRREKAVKCWGEAVKRRGEAVIFSSEHAGKGGEMPGEGGEVPRRGSGMPSKGSGNAIAKSCGHGVVGMSRTHGFRSPRVGQTIGNLRQGAGQGKAVRDSSERSRKGSERMRKGSGRSRKRQQKVKGKAFKDREGSQKGSAVGPVSLSPLSSPLSSPKSTPLLSLRTAVAAFGGQRQ